MFVVMFVHVVPSINAAHEGVVTGHWALDMNGDMHTQDSALGAGANSHQQLISGSEARTEAGRKAHSGRGLWPGSVTALSPLPAPGQCSVSPGSWLWPGVATGCHHLPISVSSDQSCPMSTPGTRQHPDTRARVGLANILCDNFGFSFGGNDSGFWKAATLISFSEFMNIFSIIEGRQKTNYPCFRSRKISFLGYFTSFQDLGINENAWSLVALFSLFPG